MTPDKTRPIEENDYKACRGLILEPNGDYSLRGYAYFTGFAAANLVLMTNDVVYLIDSCHSASTRPQLSKELVVAIGAESYSIGNMAGLIR